MDFLFHEVAMHGIRFDDFRLQMIPYILNPLLHIINFLKRIRDDLGLDLLGGYFINHLRDRDVPALFLMLLVFLFLLFFTFGLLYMLPFLIILRTKTLQLKRKLFPYLYPRFLQESFLLRNIKVIFPLLSYIWKFHKLVIIPLQDIFQLVLYEQLHDIFFLTDDLQLKQRVLKHILINLFPYLQHILYIGEPSIERPIPDAV